MRDHEMVPHNELNRGSLPFVAPTNKIADTGITAGEFRGAAALQRNKGRVLPPRPPMMTRKQRDALEALVKAPRQTRPGR